MAVIDCEEDLWSPTQEYLALTAPAFATTTIGAGTHKSSTSIKMPRAATIDQAAISVGAAGTPANLDVRIEVPGSSGASVPSGVLWTGSGASIGNTPVANDVLIATFSAPATVLRGDEISIVVQPSSGVSTISVNLNRLDVTNWGGGGEYPWGSYDTGSGYSNTGSLLCLAVHDSVTGKWIRLGRSLLALKSLAANVFNNTTGTTTGTRRGARFKVKTPRRMNRSAWKILASGTNCDFTVDAFDAAGAFIKTLASLDGNRRRASSGSGEWEIPHDVTWDIDKDTFYTIALTPNANNLTIYELVFASAAHLDALGLGQNMYANRYINGAWTPATAERPLVRLGWDGMDDGTAGAGSATAGLLIGGCRIG